MTHEENHKILGEFTESFSIFFRKGLANPESSYFMNHIEFRPKYKEVIDIIHKAGGKAFLAHPFEYKFENTIGFINNLREEAELDGIECFHPSSADDNKKDILVEYKGNRKEGYYDIPGGKIEDGEIPKQTAIREMKEETGIDIKNLKYKGIMTIEYPDRKFVFDTFISSEYNGELQEFEENTSEWIDIKELLQKEKILSNIMILDRFFIKGLIDDNYNFSMHIVVDEQENVLDVNYNLEEK